MEVQYVMTLIRALIETGNDKCPLTIVIRQNYLDNYYDFVLK